MGLQGTISPHMGNLSFLVLLDLSFNSFFGFIPHEIGHLHRLRILFLSSNQLEGSIPPTIHNYNKFDGSISKALFGSLQKLEWLGLGGNNFTGIIPQTISNLSRLHTFRIEYNHIQGSILTDLWHLPKLTILALGSNNFKGAVPQKIFNLSSLQLISFELNSIWIYMVCLSAACFLLHTCCIYTQLALGDKVVTRVVIIRTFRFPRVCTWDLRASHLPSPGMGQSCPNLEQIFLGANKLGDFSENLFFGPIPKSLGNLKYLQELPLGENQLIGQETRDKEQPNFISSLSNCRFLRELYISHNPLDIKIPDSIQNLLASLQLFLASKGQIKGLIWLHLGHNNLIGNVPFTFGRLERLQRFIILSCISNLSLLEHLMLSSNRLESSVPLNIWSLKNLLFLDLSLNFLGEHLPSNMKTLDTPEYLDLLGNQITGEIPSIIGAFESLSYLDFSNNSFQGGIPQSFGNLKGLDILNLSYNNLSGAIPKSLKALPYFKYLNLSFNKLVGEISSSGPFVNFTAKSFSGNSALCGSRIFDVSPCPTIPTYQQPKTKHILFKCILPVIASIIIFVILVYLPGRCRRINMEIPTSLNALHTLERRIISYQELFQGTNKFCESNLLGAGGFGSVYKGILSDRTIVAIKVLRTIRHRNLVKVITTCTNPEFRALVLEYMSKGNLERWLYSHNYCLDLLQRINIMVDVASALDYLHHGQSESILHCNLKPTNILLDEDMVAHVANFGITQILVENKDATHTKTLRTIGYIAPEFGFEGMVSIKSDVYSFGIVLLEMVTRKKLTDDMFAGDFTLRQLVNASVPDRMVEVVDEGLLRIEDGRDTIALQSILSSILDLGLRCSKELPNTRMDIKDVAVKLNKMKSTLFVNRNKALCQNT
ncbi:hypothetical protein I3843_10G121000 [Carya illinoinensis]|nr:hypothetical protein I3843_10G121000 [Carya illinoinensis]